ncbi:MAG: hypothetical protein IT338_18060 [Thermomicrobiales bacterium]|nr:hypothetical protein [Thermomicrobiales bacterium]
MVEKYDEPMADTVQWHNAHPTEPAEGARDPGEDADETLPPHPTEPAEGPRQPAYDTKSG